MKKIIYLLLLLSVLTACLEKNVTKQMDQIDSLVVREKYDSAYARVLGIDMSKLSSPDDSAHYYLLFAQTSVLTDHPDTSVMLDSIVIPYYIKTGNHDKLAEAYYYKGYKTLGTSKIPEAIILFKKAEEQALYTANLRLQYKIAEILSYTNEISGNHTLQLYYAKRSFDIANKTSNKEWIVYSLSMISVAHSRLFHYDSAAIYINRAMPYSRFLNKNEKSTFLTNAAYTFKQTMPDMAKKYLLESLSLEEHSITMEHLADIYYYEGKKDEAYKLWLRALSINDNIPKDNILHNILDYDIEHGKTDHVCEMVNEIIHIKDSMLNSLRNDTLKDLQLLFDHEVAMRKQEQVTSKWQKGVLVTIIIIMLMAAYIIIKRFIGKSRMQEAQMQINDYVNQIRNLEASGKESEEEIARLNKKINDYLDDKAPDLLQGRLYYEQIKADEIKTLSNSNWKRKDEQQFIDYYTAIDYRTVNRLKKTKRKEKLTTHKLFFLLLLEMGKDEKYIANLFGISERSIDTLKTRTKPVG